MADNVNKEKVIINFSTNADKVTNQTNKLSDSLDSIDVSADVAQKSMNDLDRTFDEVYEGMKPLTARMGEAEDRLYELALAGKTATDEYKGLLEVVARYRQTQIETDRVVDAAATTMGQKLAGASQLAATGVQGATAGMALFGDQSEDTEKALLKVQSAMAFADAIGSISEMGGQWRVLKTAVLESSIATKANTAATGAAAIVTKLFGGTVDTTSTSFKGLKGAIAATGIGLLLVGVTALIQNFDKVKKVVLNFVPGLEAVGEQVMSIVNAVTDFVGVTSEADRAMDKMIENADKSLAKNKKFLAEHGSQLDEYSKQKIEIVNEYNEALKEAGANQVALALEANRKLSAVDKARQDEIDKNREAAAEKERQHQEKLRKEAEDRAKKAEEERIKKAEEEAKRKQALLEEQEEEQKRALELIDHSDEEKEQRELEHQTELGAIVLKQAEQNFEDQKKIDEAKKQQDKDIQDAQFNAASAAVSAFSNIFGKSKDQQKAAVIADGAVGIAKMITANNAANIAALATPQAIATSGAAAVPVITFNNISTALGVAGTIGATAKALEAIGKGGGVSAPAKTASPTASGTNGAPQTGFQASSENQIATSISGVNQALPPIKTYVVSTDVSTAQGLDSKLIEENSFGG